MDYLCLLSCLLNLLITTTIDTVFFVCKFQNGDCAHLPNKELPSIPSGSQESIPSVDTLLSTLEEVPDDDTDIFTTKQLFSFAWQIARGMVIITLLCQWAAIWSSPDTETLCFYRTTLNFCYEKKSLKLIFWLFGQRVKWNENNNKQTSYICWELKLFPNELVK